MTPISLNYVMHYVMYNTTTPYPQLSLPAETPAETDHFDIGAVHPVNSGQGFEEVLQGVPGVRPPTSHHSHFDVTI